MEASEPAAIPAPIMEDTREETNGTGLGENGDGKDERKRDRPPPIKVMTGAVDVKPQYAKPQMYPQ